MLYHALQLKVHKKSHTRAFKGGTIYPCTTKDCEVSERQSVLKSAAEQCWELLKTTWELLSAAEHCWLLLSAAECCRALQSAADAERCWAMLRTTECYWELLGVSESCQALLRPAVGFLSPIYFWWSHFRAVEYFWSMLRAAEHHRLTIWDSGIDLHTGYDWYD